MRTFTVINLFCSVAVSALASSAGPTSAEVVNAPKAQPSTPSNTGTTAQLSEVVVTAQRRDTSLAKTPVAVAVLSADTLAKAQIVSEQDLRATVPGLSVRTGVSSNQINYSLRGQSQDAYSGARPGVLPYINEVQIGGSGGSSAFYDLQSVQVLKGPQGTLFGRSATGGAVLFTTAKPSDEFGGYASILGGDYSAFKAEGAVNLPLYGDKLIARVAGIYQTRDGFQENLYNGQREGNLEREGVRVSLAAKLSDTVHNDLVFDYLHSNSQNTLGVLSGLLSYPGPVAGGPPYIPLAYLYAGTATAQARAIGIGTVQAFVPAAYAAAVPAYYDAYFSNPLHPAGGLAGVLKAQNARGPYVVDDNGANLYRANNYILTNATTFDVDADTKIKNIFGYTNLSSINAYDVDGSPYGAAETTPIGDPNFTTFTTRQVSDELQLLGKALNERLTYVTGFYFSDERSTVLQNSDFFDIVFGGQDQKNDYIITNRTYAGYAQGTYALNDKGLSFTLGGRYTSETVGDILLPTDSSRIALGVAEAPPGYSYDQSKTYNRLSWTVGLEDQINADVLLYAVSRRAFKSGGFNGQAAPKIGGASVAGNAYGAEEVTDAELGVKFQGRVATMPAHLNLALYYDWNSDSQRTAFTVVGGAPAILTVNVPKGRVYGFELDSQIRPLQWLSLGGVANYTRASFTNGEIIANGTSQDYDQAPDTPTFSGDAYADVTVPVSNTINANLHGDVYGQTKTVTSPQSFNSAGTTIPGYALVNFRVGLANPRGGWSITANVKNAFNQLYYSGGIPTGTIYQINLLVPGEPRTFTVEVRKTF